MERTLLSIIFTWHYSFREVLRVEYREFVGSLDRGRGHFIWKICVGDADFDLKIEQWQNSHKIGYTRRRRVDYAFNYVLPLNTWKLVTWVFDNEAKLYVDGIHVATNSSLTSCPLGTIGTSEPNALLCDVDDVLVYSRALTEDEIQSLYRVGGWAN